MTRKEILGDVAAERERQIELYGERPDLDLREWIVILVEEVGELARAVQHLRVAQLDFADWRALAREEAVQVAAVAVAIAERMR